MSQLLDLSITLTPPPNGSEAIASTALRCDTLGLSHTGDLLIDPLTQKERDDLQWYLEEYWKWPYYEFAQRGKQIEALLPQLGKRLYEKVFESHQADRILQKWLAKSKVRHQISIISDMPGVLSLPWELLHSEQGFLVLRTRNPVSIVRCLSQSELSEDSASFEPPLRVLLVTARPDDAGFVDPRGIARELLDEVQKHIEEGTIAVEFLRPPTLPTLRARLSDSKRPSVHILHFDGHGAFEPEQISQDGLRLSGKGQGLLAFENDEGKLDLVEAEKLAQVLQDSGVQLAVVNACQSAMSASDDALSSVAARLIKGGIDAVVAMSASVLVASATRYVEAFYRELAAGTTTPTAQERARQALYDDPHRHISRPRPNEEGKPVELHDWWLPHFYQQRPLVLQATRPSGPLNAQLAPSSPRLSESMPAEPRYSFSGRARELLQLERHLMQGKLVVIHGFGGIGKTALVREAADWLTRTKMYDGACFVSFEHGGDATPLLSALGNFLGVYDGLYNPNDPKAALERLKPALKEKRTLVIADNLESILPGGEAPLEPAARTQLWDVLLKLAEMGAGVLLTSRDTTFGEGRLAPGKQVAHLELKGLYSEDAYALASRLLDDLQIDRARAPYADLRDLLDKMGHHPLAIQLVLPSLRTLPLSQIRADFATLLPKFVDDTVTGRNRSLLASLDYSLRRLSAEQRALLPRLALFEGGASEDDLLAITEIPESEWARLRPALEQAALLTAEQIGNFTVPFLHFHPVLAPYLRSQPGADDAALRERYAQRYYALATYLYREDRSNPQPVRALVRRELPNLRRALELLLQAEKLDDASDMATRIAMFLTIFGLARERDELRRRVDEAVAAAGTQKDGALTGAECLRESGLGEDEFAKGDVRAAYARFTNLLTRIEALPEGTPLGRGSYQHCLTLHHLALCLREGGQPAAAEGRLREALAIIDALIRQQPDDQSFIGQRGALLSDLGNVLSAQGQYSQARQAYERALKVDEQLGDSRGQAVDLGQLGTLAEKQRDYAKAKSHHAAALEIFHALGEPGMEAVAWHQLGRVAEEQKEWAEAERCYRESLSLFEQLGDATHAAASCNQLAIVATGAGRPAEAEGWWKRALELDEIVHPGSSSHAIHLSGLAMLLCHEREVLGSAARLTEARGYAEQALAIIENLDVSSETSKTLSILADIADLEGQPDAARNYRRRERETFAAFAGNSYHIDRQHGRLIADIAAAAKGDVQARVKVEEALPEFEAKGWRIAAATRRIWAGERDWQSLVEDLDRQNALLVRRVLETIADPHSIHPTEAQGKTPEQVFASLPAAIREAVERGDEAGFRQAMGALSPEEQQAVMGAMRYLQGQEEEDDEGSADALQQLEPLLQAIAVVAGGDSTHRSEIEEVLTDLETQDCHIREAVQRIWAGERDEVAVTVGLDEMDGALVRRVLEIIGGGG